MKKRLVLAWSASACLALITPTLAAGQDHPAAQNAKGPNAVLAWNANTVEAAVASCLSPANDPLHESRLYAMTHLAVHDALNAIDRRYRPYIAGLGREPGASPEAAVASAARNVLVPAIEGGPELAPGCIDAGVASVEADYTAALAAIPGGPAKAKGIALGGAAAAAILAARSDDGSDTPLVVEECAPETSPAGQYQCTPGTPFLFAPGWGGVEPFVLRDAAQFRPGPPPSLTSNRYTEDFNEVKRLGGDDVTTPSDRTADQTEIAQFWLESSPSLWNRMARTVAGARDLNLWKSARLFGLLNAAMADGYVATFDTKYLYDYWRPVTAIQQADRDGNPNTAPDPTWTPLTTTPPIPDYDSGHSVEGGAAAQVMKRVFGTDQVTFRVCSLTLPAGETCGEAGEVLRRYRSFTQAADENGLSRILVGFHFRTAVRVGIDHGRKVADRAVDRFLQPVG